MSLPSREQQSVLAVCSVIREVTQVASRSTGLPVHQLGASELKTLEPRLFAVLVARLSHVFQCHAQPDQLMSALLNARELKVFSGLKECIESVRENGAQQGVQEQKIPSVSEIHEQYKNIVPFIFSALSNKKARLSCFVSSEKSPLWFAEVAGSTQQTLRCVGYSGEIRNINLSRILQADYSRMRGGDEDATRFWREQTKGVWSAHDIKQVSLFVGRHMIPHFHQNVAEERLSQMMQKFPVRAAPKHGGPASQPKI